MGLLIPGFFGYFNAARGLLVNQVGLNVVNNNITNAGTPGYSKQRVDIETGNPYPPASIANLTRYGQIGQGPKMVGISRSHDNYIDGQIRSQQSFLGYQSALENVLGMAEGVLNEPSDSGVHKALASFFEAAHQMSLHPDNLATRSSFMSAANNMLSVFQDKATQLQDLRTSLVGNSAVPGSFEISKTAFTVSSINQKLAQLADVQDKIITVNGSGGAPNDLLDKRDKLLEDLSTEFNITVDYHEGDNLVDVRLGTNYLVRANEVIDTLSAVENTGPAPVPDDVPMLVNLTTAGTNVNADITGGTLGGYLKMGGNDTDITTVRGLLGNLDTLFNEIATQINTLQAGGLDYNGNAPTAPDDEVFALAAGTTLSIFRYSLNTNLVSDPTLIAAADGSGAFAGVGDGRNAQAMADLESSSLAALGNMSAFDYLNSFVSKLGLDSDTASGNVDNGTSVFQQLDLRRQSVQGVNIEEEMLDLMRFQRGFEAAAKSLTTLDKAIETIMGIV